MAKSSTGQIKTYIMTKTNLLRFLGNEEKALRSEYRKKDNSFLPYNLSGVEERLQAISLVTRLIEATTEEEFSNLCDRLEYRTHQQSQPV